MSSQQHMGRTGPSSSAAIHQFVGPSRLVAAPCLLFLLFFLKMPSPFCSCDVIMWLQARSYPARTRVCIIWTLSLWIEFTKISARTCCAACAINSNCKITEYHSYPMSAERAQLCSAKPYQTFIGRSIYASGTVLLTRSTAQHLHVCHSSISQL